MAKKLTPYEKTVNFIHKHFETEKDKWNAGLPNNMDEWESFEEYFDLIDVVSDLKKDNAELRCYNEKLLNDLKSKEVRLKLQPRGNGKIYALLTKWIQLLNKDAINSKDIVKKEMMLMKREMESNEKNT